MKILEITSVLPTNDLQRDLKWYAEKVGFETRYHDDMYAVLKRENVYLHLQWHADTEDDPLNGGSVIKIFVRDIEPYFKEFVERGTIQPEKLRRNTPWGTHEFGFYDLNQNAIFVVQNA
ncbi:MAG: VOC family protein [Bacteroidota bacterium]